MILPNPNLLWFLVYQFFFRKAGRGSVQCETPGQQRSLSKTLDSLLRGLFLYGPSLEYSHIFY